MLVNMRCDVMPRHHAATHHQTNIWSHLRVHDFTTHRPHTCTMNEPAKMAKCGRAPCSWHQDRQPRGSCQHGMHHLPNTNAHGPRGISQHTSGVMYGRGRLGRQKSTTQTIVHIAITTHRRTNERGRFGHHALCRLGTVGGRGNRCHACQATRHDGLIRQAHHQITDQQRWQRPTRQICTHQSVGGNVSVDTDSVKRFKLANAATRRKSSACQDQPVHDQTPHQEPAHHQDDVGTSCDQNN